MILRAEEPEIGDLAVPGFVPKLTRTPAALMWTGPGRPGAHNTEIYEETLKLDSSQLRDLEADGVI